MAAVEHGVGRLRRRHARRQLVVQLVAVVADTHLELDLSSDPVVVHEPADGVEAVLIRYRPAGGETICPPPMAVRSKNRGESTSVRGRVRSPHISGGRRWLSCR